MPATNLLGVEYPLGSDTFAPHTDMQDLAASLYGRIFAPVANTTARNALAASFSPTVNKPLYVFRADATAGKEIEYTTDGITWRVIDVTLIPGAWQNVTFQNGWSNLGGVYQTVQYRKEGDVVRMRGVAKPSTTTSASPFVLPAGFRPPASMILNSNVGGGAFDTFVIDNAGVVDPVGSVAAGSGFSFDATFSITA